MKTVPTAWIITEEWPTGPADPDSHGWDTLTPDFALCVMCGKPTENLASDDTEYQCAPCANVR